MDSKEEAKALMKKGYRVTSRKHRQVTRVDRPDWRDYMAVRHAPWDIEDGLEWVECLGRGAADQYRRVYSKDTLVVSKAALSHIGSSNHDPVGYVEISERA